MEPALRSLLQDYTQALQQYLTHGDEADLHRVDELGRRAVAEGYGTLELTGVHHQAAITILLQPAGGIGDCPSSGVRMFCSTCPSWYSSPDQGARTVETVNNYLRTRLSEVPPAEKDGLTAAGRALRHVTELLEQESKRIAHALHDEAGQLLTVVHLKLAEAARGLPPQCAPCFGEISVLLDRIETELRHLAHEVRPTLLDDFGLLPAIQLLADGISRRTGISVLVEGKLEERLAPQVEAVVYRAVQECLTNASRHSGARSVRVSLSAGSQLHCTIQDDGKGFDVAAILERRSERGFGLTVVREQVELLGGTLLILSTAGHGTEFLVTVPLQNQTCTTAAERAAG